MKKTTILAASVYSLLLITSTPVWAATEVWQMDGATGETAAQLDDSFTGADLDKYLKAQSYQGASPELGKALESKYGGAWSGALIGGTVQFEAGEKSAFDKKYEELSQQASALQKNGTMDGAERDKQLGAVWKQIGAYNAADSYAKKKMIISTTYGIPMTEIDKLVSNLDTSGNSIAPYLGKAGTSDLLQALLNAAQDHDSLEKAFKSAGIDVNSAASKLLNNHALLSLQQDSLLSLSRNTVNQASQWDKSTIEQNIADRSAWCQSYINNSGGQSWKVPQSCGQADFGAFNSYTPEMMAAYSKQFSSLFGQAEGLYGQTLDGVKAQYDEIKDAMDQEYLAMKKKVADGLATNEDLYALMDSNKELLSSFEEQIELAEFNYEDIQTGMMDTLSSKGIGDSAFFTGDATFSSATSGMGSFFGGGGNTFAGLTGGGGGGGKSGGGGTAPLVNH